MIKREMIIDKRKMVQKELHSNKGRSHGLNMGSKKDIEVWPKAPFINLLVKSS